MYSIRINLRKDIFSQNSSFVILYKNMKMLCTAFFYLLMNFKKLVRTFFISHYDLQILKVSVNLEILDVNVVDTPWNTPAIWVYETFFYFSQQNLVL